jgi:hypothetical protein
MTGVTELSDVFVPYLVTLGTGKAVKVREVGYHHRAIQDLVICMLE